MVSGVAAAYIGLDSGFKTPLAVGAALLIGVVAYSAVFTWAGLITTRALSFAIVYVFLWEGAIGTFISGVRYLSVRGYTLAVMHGLDETGLESISDRVIEFPAAIGGAVLVTAVFFLADDMAAQKDGRPVNYSIVVFVASENIAGAILLARALKSVYASLAAAAWLPIAPSAVVKRNMGLRAS